MLIDFIRLEAGLPWDKIKHIREALCRWECRKSCTLKELQPIIDTLHLAHCHIRLNNGFREDLRMWKQLIDNWNGTNMFMNEA